MLGDMLIQEKIDEAQRLISEQRLRVGLNILTLSLLSAALVSRIVS